VAKPKAGHRIVLQLDPRVALEAIILNRLERIPAARRQEWLRGLLLLGFRSECLTLRGAGENSVPRSTSAFVPRLAGASSRMIAVKADRPRIETRVPRVTAGGKPFAALSQVMG